MLYINIFYYSGWWLLKFLGWYEFIYDDKNVDMLFFYIFFMRGIWMRKFLIYNGKLILWEDNVIICGFLRFCILRLYVN